MVVVPAFREYQPMSYVHFIAFNFDWRFLVIHNGLEPYLRTGNRRPQISPKPYWFLAKTCYSYIIFMAIEITGLNLCDHQLTLIQQEPRLNQNMYQSRTCIDDATERVLDMNISWICSCGWLVTETTTPRFPTTSLVLIFQSTAWNGGSNFELDDDFRSWSCPRLEDYR